MEKTVEKELNHKCDAEFIRMLKEGNKEGINRFFYGEIVGILREIQSKIYQDQVELDELVIEMYLYLSENNWKRLDCFDGKNGCRLRTWMIPVAWRYFMSIRERLLHTENNEGKPDAIRDYANDDLRIQIAIDVNAVLSKMPNRRYAEIIRLLLIEGYAAEDVADMLEMRVENVYNLKHRAITQFIKLYGKR